MIKPSSAVARHSPVLIHSSDLARLSAETLQAWNIAL